MGSTEVVETRAEHNERFNVEVPDEPYIPDVVAHVWGWFWRISARRNRGMDICPITDEGIRAWMSNNHKEIQPLEMAMITDMDDAFLEAMAKESEITRDMKTSASKGK